MGGEKFEGWLLCCFLSRQIKLADFGFARHFTEEGTKKPVDMSSLAGTPVFMVRRLSVLWAMHCNAHIRIQYSRKCNTFRTVPHPVQYVQHTLQTVPHPVQYVQHILQTVPHPVQYVQHTTNGTPSSAVCTTTLQTVPHPVQYV